MDFLNMLFVYTVVVAVVYVIYGVAVAFESAIAQVTGHTYASLIAEASLACKMAPIKAAAVFANITEGKAAASPRYFG